MELAIRYFSRTGNTRKLAFAIGEALGIEAKDLNEPLKKADILFLGSAVYGAKLDDAVVSYLRNLDKTSISLIIPFSTTAIVKSSYPLIKKIADEQYLKLSEEHFFCKAQAGFLHKGRPNRHDLEQAKAFALRMTQ